MSTIICIKDGDSLVLGTDSRFMRSDFSTVTSDSVQKLFELAPGLFFATCGWSFSSDFLAQKIPEIIRELATRDIRVLADALDRVSRLCLYEVVSTLFTLPQPQHSRVSDTLAGRNPIQGFMLAGRSNGKLGFVYYEYFLRDGQVVLNPKEYFDKPRLIEFVGCTAFEQIRQDPATWTQNPVRVMLKILETQKRASPFVGGPSQVALIDGRGGRWVNRPPAVAMNTAQPVCATISAAISMTAPTITVTGSPFTINLDSSNGLKISGNGTIVNLNVISSGGRIQAVKALRVSDGYYSVVDPAAFVCYDASNNANAVLGDALGAGFVEANRQGVIQGSLSANALGQGATLFIRDSAGSTGFQLDTTTTYTAASASAGANALPANPVGFLIVTIAGVSRKIPYYA